MDTEPKTPIDRDPSQLAQALPWYQNGTLSKSDRAWVAQMLGADDEAADGVGARGQLDFDRRVAEVLEQQLAAVPADIGWASLIQRVRTDGSRGSWLQRLARLVAPIMSPQLGMAMAAVLAVQTIGLGVLMTQRQGSGQGDSVEFRSAGGQKPITAIRALMNESITEKTMREALSASGALIVDGPNPLGEYWIVTDERDPEAVARSLREAGVIASYVIDQRLQGQ